MMEVTPAQAIKMHEVISLYVNHADPEVRAVGMVLQERLTDGKMIALDGSTGTPILLATALDRLIETANKVKQQLLGIKRM